MGVPVWNKLANGNESHKYCDEGCQIDFINFVALCRFTDIPLPNLSSRGLHNYRSCKYKKKVHDKNFMSQNSHGHTIILLCLISDNGHYDDDN